MDAIEKTVHAWTAVDFPRLQRDVDAKALEIQDTTSSSLQERKELAQATKEFKRLEDADRLNEINPLLKRYQSVIDSMNKRGKSSESALLSVWRSLIAVPDPTPLLSDALSVSTLRKDLEKLREENESLQEKITSLADYDDIKKESVKERERLEKIHNLQMKAKEDEWTAKLAEMERVWSEEKENLTKQVVELKVSEKMLRSKAGQNDDDDDEDDDDDDYQQIISPPQQISDTTIKNLEKRNEELRRELVASKSSIDVIVEEAVQEKDKLIESLERENALISAKLDSERLKCRKLKEEKDDLTSSYERNIKQLEHDITILQNYKSNTSDYEEVCKELEILKKIQFGDEDTDDENISHNNDIESAIVARNKKLNTEIVDIRRKYDESLKKCQEHTQNIEKLNNLIETLKNDNTRLENDLINFDHHNGRGNIDDEQWETMSMISSVAGGAPSISHGKVSPAASIAGTERSYEGSIIATNNTSSLLPIITQQRDRFRTRNKELEEENKKNFGKIVELKREINNLKNDNRQLYEKIRFLEYHKQISQQTVGDIENRYRLEYENDLHPIEQFRLMETQRINSNITPWDRIFIQITRTVLATPFTRWLFVAYCTSLHLLVMILMLMSR